MDHGPAVELGVDHAAKKKSKLGVFLFFVYLIVYAGFVAIGVADYELMGKIVLGNQNLAVVYGFGLIIFAILLGLYYNWQCTKYENLMNKED
ncbi:MAG: DUF485 domain-containing protein [Bacteroidetes bacterium]|jgi:uncharacterized membrane protein (DUF485 family)|nr:DUF485 domain-containing protein [Bacteroidota bacterium]MBT6687946.1 DUF485 domain-containing protein [Bacteroidota bacterium]MBT7143285.1 DUF485 domain-containing protein [Bacteroidota bacterium]MBT7490266.1 DUF485 domain-containing protein [Bacteroidota bacterium]